MQKADDQGRDARGRLRAGRQAYYEEEHALNALFAGLLGSGVAGQADWAKQAVVGSVGTYLARWAAGVLGR